MLGSFFVRKVATAILVVSMLSLALAGCAGPAGVQGAAGRAGPSGPPGPAAPEVKPVSVIIVPNVVELKKVKKIQIYGSGFTPGAQVSIGIPGVPKSTKVPELKDVWFGAVTVNDYGAFAFTADLSRSLWRLIPKTIATEDALGAYTIVATNIQGETATAPLTVIEAAK